jgi:hypothetical protein
VSLSEQKKAELMSGGIPCSALKSSDPDSLEPGCLDEATYWDSKGNPWCAAHGPSGAGVKAQSRASIRQSELNRLVQQLVELREALKPFAIFGSSLPPIDPSCPRITDSGVMFNVYANMVNYNITCTDLRRAKDLLEKLAAEDYDRLVEVTEQKMLGPLTEQKAALEEELKALQVKAEATMRAELKAELMAEGPIVDVVGGLKKG